MKNKEKVLRALILFSENPVVERKGGIQVMSTYKSLTYDDRKNIEKMCNIYKTINFYNKASNSGNVINATKKGV